MSALTRALWPVASAIAIAAIACSDYTEGNTSAGTCRGASLASGTAHGVVCPGVVGCNCPAPAACCMGSLGGNDGACMDPRACGGVSLSCDGPEDCAQGAVCCLTSAGSSCMSAAECTGQWLCRSDSQCNGSPGGPSCVAADFGQSGVTDRGLDGLIGSCGR